MKSRLFSLMASLVLASVLLGACNMPTTTPAFIPPANVPNLVPHVPAANNVVFVFGSPMVAPPGVSRTIHVWVYTSQSRVGATSGPTGISNVNISYAGNRIGTIALDPNQPFADGTLQWTPPAPPGDYTVQADGGGAFIPNGQSDLSATVCVDSVGITIDALEVPGDTVCAPPPGLQTTAPFGITHTNASATMGCDISILSFDIGVDDHSNQIRYAYVELANVSNDFGEHIYGMPGPGPAVYSMSLGWRADELVRQLAGTNTITWTAAVVTQSGQVITDGPHQLAVTFPTCPARPGLSVPVIPRIPNFIPSLQPAQPLNAVQTEAPAATAMTCGAGTTYDAVSQSCLKNATNTPLPTKRPPACKKYNDEASCGAASCHWDSKTSTCGEP